MRLRRYLSGSYVATALSAPEICPISRIAAQSSENPAGNGERFGQIRNHRSTDPRAERERRTDTAAYFVFIDPFIADHDNVACTLRYVREFAADPVARRIFCPKDRFARACGMRLMNWMRQCEIGNESGGTSFDATVAHFNEPMLSAS